jgi:hypothetical protein
MGLMQWPGIAEQGLRTIARPGKQGEWYSFENVSALASSTSLRPIAPAGEG